MQDQTRALAEAILEFRKWRGNEFPAGLFAESGWEFLLALFIADADGKCATGRDLCKELGAPPSVASRWLKYLSGAGLIDGDGEGDLDDQLTMAPVAVERMERLLDHAKQLRAALLPDL